jgi:8-oxo-dGTP diphosphatase
MIGQKDVNVHYASKAIVVLGGKVLLLKLNPAEFKFGHHAPELGDWDVPGGRMEKEEGYEDALKREVREETGLEVVVERELGNFEFSPRPDTIIQGKSYLCMASSAGVVVSEEHLDYRWVTPEESRGFKLSKWLSDCIAHL